MYLPSTVGQFDALWPGFGEELAVQYESMTNARDVLTGEPGVLMGEALGIKEGLVGVEETFGGMVDSWA